MILGALIHAGADVQRIRQVLASFGEADLQLSVDEVQVDGEAARYVRSLAPHADGHPHHHLSDILGRVERCSAAPAARARARRIFEILADAEATVHGGTPESVHLHEVGELDSIMDVVGIAVALHDLGDPRVTATPVPSGRGTVDTSHGRLDCPVPAVVEIVRRFGVPLLDVDVPGETVTPTGAAVLAAVCAELGAAPPAGTPVVTGVGAGTKRFPGRPNVVRAHGYRDR